MLSDQLDGYETTFKCRRYSPISGRNIGESGRNDLTTTLMSSSNKMLNLGSIRYLIEFELADSAAKQTQRHGRIQRADSIHKNVFVFQLITRDSWDEVQWKIVNKKQEYSKKILD